MHEESCAAIVPAVTHGCTLGEVDGSDKRAGWHCTETNTLVEGALTWAATLNHCCQKYSGKGVCATNPHTLKPEM